MKKWLGIALLSAALYGAWQGLGQTDFLSNDVRFQVHGEYGALLGG